MRVRGCHGRTCKPDALEMKIGFGFGLVGCKWGGCLEPPKVVKYADKTTYFPDFSSNGFWYSIKGYGPLDKMIFIGKKRNKLKLGHRIFFHCPFRAPKRRHRALFALLSYLRSNQVLWHREMDPMQPSTLLSVVVVLRTSD